MYRLGDDALIRGVDGLNQYWVVVRGLKRQAQFLKGRVQQRLGHKLMCRRQHRQRALHRQVRIRDLEVLELDRHRVEHHLKRCFLLLLLLAKNRGTVHDKQ